MSFREQGIDPADGFTRDGVIVRPLVPSDVVLDHEAVTSSREFLCHWGQEPPYPPEDFSVDDNLEDLEQMDGPHTATAPIRVQRHERRRDPGPWLHLPPAQ